MRQLMMNELRNSRRVTWLSCHDSRTWLTNVIWLTHLESPLWDGRGSSWWTSHGTPDAWHDSVVMTHVTWLTNVTFLMWRDSRNVTWLTHPDTQLWDGCGSWRWASHGTPQRPRIRFFCYSSRWHTVLQCVAVCCSVLQWLPPFCYSSRWHTVSSRCSFFPFVAVYFGSVLQCVAVCRSVFFL